jgi:hypothetical protein
LIVVELQLIKLRRVKCLDFARELMEIPGQLQDKLAGWPFKFFTSSSRSASV